MKKDVLLKECVNIMHSEKLEKWYNKNMKGKSQENTISVLEQAVKNNELTIKEALVISFVVGFQWLGKFEGVQ